MACGGDNGENAVASLASVMRKRESEGGFLAEAEEDDLRGKGEHG